MINALTTKNNPILIEMQLSQYFSLNQLDSKKRAFSKIEEELMKNKLLRI